MVEIISYTSEYAANFKALNLEWLEKYNLTEPSDLEVINNPQGTIIEHGGFVFLAKEGDEIIGTAGLMKEHEGVYELAKMAVAPASQGKGISKLLIEKCIEKAKEIKAEKVILFSNSQLQTAIKLYEKYGFKHIAVTDNPFLTADIKMELSL